MTQSRKEQKDSQKDPKKSANEFIEIGKIGKPIGLSGAMLFWSFDPQSESIFVLETIYLENKPYQILDAYSKKRAITIRLENIDSKENAQKLCHFIVSAKKSDLPKLKKDEYYLTDLVGLKVKDEQDKLIGVVTDIKHDNLQSYLEVKSENNQTYEIPATSHFIAQVKKGEWIELKNLAEFFE